MTLYTSELRQQATAPQWYSHLYPPIMDCGCITYSCRLSMWYYLIKQLCIHVCVCELEPRVIIYFCLNDGLRLWLWLYMSCCHVILRGGALAVRSFRNTSRNTMDYIVNYYITNYYIEMESNHSLEYNSIQWYTRMRNDMNGYVIIVWKWIHPWSTAWSSPVIIAPLPRLALRSIPSVHPSKVLIPTRHNVHSFSFAPLFPPVASVSLERSWKAAAKKKKIFPSKSVFSFWINRYSLLVSYSAIDGRRMSWHNPEPITIINHWFTHIYHSCVTHFFFNIWKNSKMTETSFKPFDWNLKKWYQPSS